MTPLFERPLHVGCPNLGDRARLLARLEQMLDRRWLTNDGPLLREFEQRICELVGVAHCVAMCNATVGLEIAIRALNLSGEVIVPAFTFIATAHALQWQQITPVFCDIDPATQNLDPAEVERLITPKTRGIVGVHVWGRPCDVQALEAIAERYGLVLLFDAAHALGCSSQQRMLGRFGRAEVFSFHATKFINCGEGGAVVTDDAELAAKMRLMRNFGFAGYDNVSYVGTNGKMSELSAAMGITSLESIHHFVAVNRANHDAYRTALAGVPGLTVMDYDLREQNNFQYVVVEVDAKQCGLTRDDLVALLHAENVLARRYFSPGCHNMEPYRSRTAQRPRLPHTDRLCGAVVQLPTGTAVTTSDIQQIAHFIGSAIADPPAALRRLRQRNDAVALLESD